MCHQAAEVLSSHLKVSERYEEFEQVDGLGTMLESLTSRRPAGLTEDIRGSIMSFNSAE